MNILNKVWRTLVVIGLEIILLVAFFDLYSKVGRIEENLDIHDTSIKGIFNELEQLYNRINNFNDELTSTNSSLDNLQSRVSNLETQLYNLNERIKQRGLVNPTYSQLVDFINRDDTEKREYDNETFNCADFTNLFIQNFAKEGFFSCFTELVYTNDEAHAIVAVNTTDRGLVYVEPQDDKIVFDLKVGDDYCEKVNWRCHDVIKHIKSCFNVGG